MLRFDKKSISKQGYIMMMVVDRIQYQYKEAAQMANIQVTLPKWC